VNVAPSVVDAAVRTMLATRTGFPVGLGEPPEMDPVTYPFMVVTPIPGQAFYGGMQDPLDMAELIYQVTSVGKIYGQATAASDRAVAAFADHWRDITGACGVPEVARRGTVRVQDGLWQEILSITQKVSAR
jgi:hypothetical protein